MHNIFNIVLDFVFPPRAEELKLRAISPEKLLEISPRSSVPEFFFINAVLSYKDALVRELIWQIKYKKNKRAIECAGYVLYMELLKYGHVNYGEPNSGQNILLIPIPISNKRRSERGYNQCELIIDEILKLDTGNRFEKDFDILKRMKHVEKQTFMKRGERLKNTRNIFEVKNNISDEGANMNASRNYNKNAKIIIIDDVTTTGSTLSEARDTLMNAGFGDVTGLAVAH